MKHSVPANTQRIYLIRRDAGTGAHWHICDHGSWDSGPMTGVFSVRPFELANSDRDLPGALVWCENVQFETMVFIAQRPRPPVLSSCTDFRTIARGTYARLWPDLLAHGKML